MEQGAKIIIIDDNTDYLFTMETFLKRNGFETLTAEDGKKAMELIQKERPDLILMDIMMEGLFSGFQLSKKLQSDPDLKNIPVIGISGIGPELGIQKDKHLLLRKYFDSDNFFEKPVDKNKLLAKMKEILEG
ncbi:MAG: response regulator [Thermodesulfovibrionales bacterium]|nr:response regulator [Thermodesulfovibrionales bacterium]